MGGLLILILTIAIVVAVLIFPELMGHSKFSEFIIHFKHNTLKICSRLIQAVRRIQYKELSDLRSISDFDNYLKSLFLLNVDLEQSAIQNDEPDLNELNCRILETIQQEANCVTNVFCVEICGLIHSPGDQHRATIRISILDVTDGSDTSQPVQARVKQWQAPAPSGKGHVTDFFYSADLGKLPHHDTTLSNWTSIAKLRLDWLVFPRKGRRNLKFNISILSAEDNQELACCRCYYCYDNPSFGYIDVPKNIEHTKTLAVALAFAVSAADGKMYDCEIQLIKKWAREHIDLSRESDKAERKLDKALNEVITFFREGNKLDSYDICREIVEIAPVSQRYEILDICLHVAKANGSVVTEELEFLRNLTNWLEIDIGKFRAMMEKVIPVEMHEVKDVESILGVTSDMNAEIARTHLNKEYVKWNARVTNTNPEIQSQADQMLKLIAEARTQFVQEDIPVQKDKKEPKHKKRKKRVKQAITK